MTPFFRLLLGHLVGDFVLQTIGLVHYKAHSWRGLFLHAGIVVASSALCLWEYLPKWWLWLVPLFVSHLLIDWGKILSSRNLPRWGLLLFLLDQTLHVGMVVAVVCWAERGWPYHLATEIVGGAAGQATLFLFLLGVLAAVFVMPLLEVQVARTVLRAPSGGTGGNNSPPASLADRLWGGGERIAALAMLCSGGVALWFVPVAFLPRAFVQLRHRDQPYPARVRRVKIATSIVCTALLGLLLCWLGGRL